MPNESPVAQHMTFNEATTWDVEYEDSQSGAWQFQANVSYTLWHWVQSDWWRWPQSDRPMVKAKRVVGGADG